MTAEGVTPFPVLNADDAKRASLVLKRIKQLQDTIKQSYASTIDLAHKAHKEAISSRDKHLTPLLDVEKKLKQSLLDYNAKIEAEARERERLANEELAKIAEQRKSEILSKAKNTDDEWEKETLTQEAENVKAISVDVQKNVLKDEGVDVSVRKTWKAKVIDLDLLPKAYMLVNESLLDKCAKDESFRARGIAGVEFYQVTSLGVRKD